MKYLKVHNIPIRESGTNLRRRRGLGYGTKIRNREEEVHKRELETIAKMKSLRDQRFSYWKIADILNSMKIPTKTGRAKWHARTVHRIFNDNPSESKNPSLTTIPSS